MLIFFYSRAKMSSLQISFCAKVSLRGYLIRSPKSSTLESLGENIFTCDQLPHKQVETIKNDLKKVLWWHFLILCNFYHFL